MKMNDFYEVDGCNWFIPVDFIKENKCTKELEVVATESGRITFVPTIYKFPKPQEPQKPVVPQFVAEWIESKKEYFSDSSAIYMYDNLTLDNNGGYYHDVWLWAIAHHHDFIKAWHDGYEIEKEKLYTAMLKISGEYLRIDCNGNFDHFRVCKKYILDGARGYQFTEDDLVKYHILGNDNYEVEEVEE
jgi:hypothetical protein